MDDFDQIDGKEIIKVQVEGQTKNILVLRNERSTKLFEVHSLVEEFNRKNETGIKVISHKDPELRRLFLFCEVSYEQLQKEAR